MIKEEILDNHTFIKMTLTKYQREHVLEAMQEYADQEKEKVAVAFSEWKDNNVVLSMIFNDYLIIGKNEILKSNSDLYKYFINNVYNK